MRVVRLMDLLSLLLKSPVGCNCQASNEESLKHEIRQYSGTT